MNIHLSVFKFFSKISISRARSLPYLGPKVWDILPNICKVIYGQEKFKKAIKKGKPEYCPCRIWREYIENVGLYGKQCLNYLLAKYGLLYLKLILVPP